MVHRGVRFPTVGERFGVSASTRGNADLEVEKALGIDLGATLAPKPRPQSSYFVDLALFERSTDDLIALRRSSLGYVRPFNVGSARFFGAEISGEAVALDHVRVVSSVTLLDPRDTTTGRTTQNDLIPFTSQITTNQRVELYRAREHEAVSHLGISGSLNYRSGRVADPAGLMVIPEQWVFDVSSRAQFARSIDLRMRLENVLDTARYDTLGYPLPGRNFFMSLEITSL